MTSPTYYFPAAHRVSFSVAPPAHHGYADLRNSVFDVIYCHPFSNQSCCLLPLSISNDVYSPLVDGDSSLWKYSRDSAVSISLEVYGCPSPFQHRISLIVIWIVQASWKSSSSSATFCLCVKTIMISCVWLERWRIDSVGHTKECSLFVCRHNLHCHHYNHLPLPPLFAANVLHPQWWYVALLPTFPSLVPWIAAHIRFVDDGNDDERRYDLELRWSSSMLDEERSFFNPQCLEESQVCHFSYDQRCKRQDARQHPLKI